MSEFLAEARILVRPDTSKFRAELETALSAATAKPITIPVVPIVAGGIAAAAAETGVLTAAQKTAAIQASLTASAITGVTEATSTYVGVTDAAVVSAQSAAAAMEKESAAALVDAAALSKRNSSLVTGARGAAAQGLSLVGLRAGTLAASSAFLAGTVAVLAFGKAVQSAANLETELNVFKVTAGATADEMDRVSASAKQLGRDITLPGVTAGTAAEAMTELAKAGLSVQDSLAGARGALQLSTAAQIDVKDATTLTAGALNAFQLSGTEAVRVADLLTGAAKESQGEITDMGTALGQAAAVSHLFGVSIDDTITLLTELAQAGIAGGRAGTSLRVAFLRLVNPTAAGAEALKKLNVQIRDAAGNLRPQIFTDIQEALQGYTKAQQQATLATIFGADAIRTAAIIGNRGAGAFEATKDAVTEAGLAQQLAAARTQGFQGDIENLSNQVSALGLTFGELAKGPTALVVKALAEVVSEMNDAVNGAVALAKAQVGLEKAIADSIPFLDQFGSHLGDIAKVSSFLNPLTAQFKLLSQASKRFGDDTTDSTPKVDAYGKAIDSVTDSVGALGVALLQSAADSKINTQAVTANVAALLQSAADSRIDFSKLGQTDTSGPASLGPKQIKNIIGGFDAEEVRAKIAGNNKQLVDVLQTEQAFLERQLQRDVVKNRPALRRLIESALLGVVNDIDSIQSKAESDAAALKAKAAKAAADAAQAVRDREQALLAQFGIARDQRQNRVAQAAQTAGLQDDIVQEKKLKALVLQQIAEVKDRISIEGGRAAAVTALRAILTQVNGQLKDLAKQQQDAAQKQREALLQGISLDVDLAQITGNQAAEVKARNRAIAVLNKELAAEAKAHGKTTVAYKTIRNEIAAQNAALKEIAAERQKGQSFAQASFEFLQAQQGFASNLLGNLIPTGATGGLVGGGSPVQAALTPVAGLADGKSSSGPTAGQSNVTNATLLRILDQLKILNGSQQAPEAQRQNRVQQAVMDGGVGG